MSETTSVKGAAERTAAVSFTEINARRLGPIRRYFRSHPRVMDGLVIFGYFAATILNLIFSDDVPGGWWTLGPVLAAGAALIFRRSHPLLVLGFISVLEPLQVLLSEGNVTVGFGIWFALYAVAVKHQTRTVAIASASAAVLSITPLWFAPALEVEEAPFLVWIVSGFVLMWYVLAIGFGMTIRRDRLHENELREWADRNAELASANERNRIAREMHDVVAHSLSVMVALSDGAAVVMKRDQERAREVLSELSATGRTALADMRRVLGVLREPDAAPLAPLPATGSLASLLEGFRVAGLPIRVSLSGPGLPGDPAFELTVYRIIQESLTNVLRYGKSVTAVGVSISRTGDLARIRVSDDGRGTMVSVVSVGSGQGIAGMRQRAAIYAGTVECGPGPDGGWIVNATLTVPVNGEADGR
ncbi:sensor histidine kinase [Arthrobacter sp. H5]|uniref:sensor histidine kinase n=1 Tax=Arthrobacter sp. H5 TaxID=1267973 RepID=UPI00047F3900|nr:sensor histidine kinase [Arthrobacter sp. H5]